MAHSQTLAIQDVRRRKTSDDQSDKQKTKSFKHLGKNAVLELPPAEEKRWTVRSKAAVVAAIRGGVLTLEDACRRYALSPAEYASWESGLDTLGLDGLALAGRQLRRRARAYTAK